MAEKITAQEARDMIAALDVADLEAQLAQVMPFVYDQIRKTVDKRETSVDMAIAKEMFPRADLAAAKTSLEADGYEVTGTTISWANP